MGIVRGHFPSRRPSPDSGRAPVRKGLGSIGGRTSLIPFPSYLWGPALTSGLPSFYWSFSLRTHLYLVFPSTSTPFSFSPLPRPDSCLPFLPLVFSRSVDSPRSLGAVEEGWGWGVPRRAAGRKPWGWGWSEWKQCPRPALVSPVVFPVVVLPVPRRTPSRPGPQTEGTLGGRTPKVERPPYVPQRFLAPCRPVPAFPRTAGVIRYFARTRLGLDPSTPPPERRRRAKGVGSQE